MKDANNIELDPSRPDWSPPRVMFIVASLILLTGFLMPFSAKILDALWVCSFCLAGAVTIICMAARNSSDLIGFVPMMLGLTLLRLVVGAGTARRIIQDKPAGILLSGTGSTLASGWPLGAVLICLLLAVMIVIVVFIACQRITLASTGYLKRILPLKRMGIKTDLQLGVIDEPQANMLNERVDLEGRFFAGMNGITLLMRAEAVICIFILLACLVIPAMNSAVNGPFGADLLSGVAPAVVALSIFTLIPATIVAVACGALMSKDTLILRIDEQEEPTPSHAKKITVVALDSDGAEDTGLLNPDFMLHRSPGEHVVEFEPNSPNGIAASLSVSTDISCRNAKEYYEKLSQVICTMQSRPRVILLASDKVHSLPVTVAVNIAIRLAQKKQKVLLVDTDAERNAIANVFDLNPELMQKKVQSSCFENLSVCSVSAEKLNKLLRKTDILSRFSTTLVYTPNVPMVNAAANKEGVKPGAFYFIDGQDSNIAKTAAEKLSFCSWLCLVPSIQSVLDSKR